MAILARWRALARLYSAGVPASLTKSGPLILWMWLHASRGGWVGWAISRSLRVAFSGSANGLGVMCSMRQPCFLVRAARYNLQRIIRQGAEPTAYRVG